MGFKVVESQSSNLALATRLLLLPSARKRPMATWLVDPGDAFCLLRVEAAALPDKQPTLAMASARSEGRCFLVCRLVDDSSPASSDLPQLGHQLQPWHSSTEGALKSTMFKVKVCELRLFFCAWFLCMVGCNADPFRAASYRLHQKQQAQDAAVSNVLGTNLSCLRLTVKAAANSCALVSLSKMPYSTSRCGAVSAGVPL